MWDYDGDKVGFMFRMLRFLWQFVAFALPSRAATVDKQTGQLKDLWAIYNNDNKVGNWTLINYEAELYFSFSDLKLIMIYL